ncbi:glycosyltransferase family 4 protein [Reichenbachiella carrageenanivorans]|uniref:Glycosyltransferase family 4 protein n=1 Tax=Reichenbachiella carrageenanivorans TaxID=2979869 RepID=A0ABY6D696_9BACT|nr:glycosyltransferase family 4 protein [Reichenbachiella carrageenanivorans]UXX80593.1 glycosyltransferase family 4 protein [Reichenbachiella carrageenanivorans]
MNILILAKDYPPKVGGVENYSQNLAEGLRKYQNCQVLSFAIKDSPISKVDRLPVKRIQPIIESEFVKSIQFSLMVLWILSTTKVDVIYATTWKVAAPVFLLKRIFNFKLFITVHGAEITRHKNNRLTMAIMRTVLKSARQIISVSDFTKTKVLEYCKDLKPNSVKVVPNGIHFEDLKPKDKINSRKRLGLSQDSLVLLTISRIDQRKGQGIVIEAIPKLISTYPQLRYIIVGDGPYRQQLEKRVKQLKIEAHVFFTGFVDFKELDYYYSACDMFVLLNTMESDQDFEGFGLVFAEAAYYKKISIAGNNGGPMEVINNKVTGYLIEPNTTNLLKLFKEVDLSPEHLTKMGEAAYRRTAKKYDIQKMIHQTNSIITENR